jgi:anion-transporting  ArsA/GET3 family ATPase
MAQAKERSANASSQIPFQDQAPEVRRPQVQVAEVAMDKAMRDESQPISKKLRKLFNKVKLNARYAEELKNIKSVKANIDASLYRNYRTNF